MGRIRTAGLLAISMLIATGAIAQQNVISATEKGSFFVLPKIEVRWNANGTVVQNTYVHVINDSPEDVDVFFFCVNGDEPLPPMGGEPAHPGWNRFDFRVSLTGNQPWLYDAATGGGWPPFWILSARWKLLWPWSRGRRMGLRVRWTR